MRSGCRIFWRGATRRSRHSSRDGRISDYELRNLLVFLFGAGYDTSKNMLTLILYLMLGRPEMYRRCAVDFPYARRVTREALRYISVSMCPAPW